MQIVFSKIATLREDNEYAHCHFRSIIFKDKYHIFEEDLINGHWQIFKRTSEDGINVNPKGETLFPFGSPGSFDEWGKADPTVIFDGHWKMWFDAMNKEYYWDKFGYATSEDGETWINHGSVLSRGDGWDRKSIHHPVVIKYSGKYYLYYTGGDTVHLRHIGMAVSEDGINWTKIPEPVIETWTRWGKMGAEWDSKYIRPSAPVLLNGFWNMFYWGCDMRDHHSMGLAVSNDLINWIKVDCIASGTDEHDGITGSCAISDGNKAKIWFTTWDNARAHLAEIYYE